MDFDSIMRSHYHDQFFFVQIGANDGLKGDPIHDHILTQRWYGLLVEPLPEVFARLLETYEGQAGLAFENVAITAQNGPVQFFRHLKYDDCSGLAPVTRIQTAAVEKNQMEEITVRGVTMDALLAKHHVETIDLLQIDTEGWDYNVIQSIPWDRVVPRLIHFEHKHMSAELRELCAKYLDGHGYKLQAGHSHGHNTLAVLTEVKGSGSLSME